MPSSPSWRSRGGVRFYVQEGLLPPPGVGAAATTVTAPGALLEVRPPGARRSLAEIREAIERGPRLQTRGHRPRRRARSGSGWRSCRGGAEHSSAYRVRHRGAWRSWRNGCRAHFRRLDERRDDPVPPPHPRVSGAAATPMRGAAARLRPRPCCATTRKVTLTQRYRTTKPSIEAVYVFPLDETAAVCGFEAG